MQKQPRNRLIEKIAEIMRQESSTILRKVKTPKPNLTGEYKALNAANTLQSYEPIKKSQMVINT